MNHRHGMLTTQNYMMLTYLIAKIFLKFGRYDDNVYLESVYGGYVRK